MRPYVGLKATDGRIVRTVFRAESEPTHDSHGHLYNMVIGPFRTAHAAHFCRLHGEGNPHTTTVAACEKVAKRFKRLADGSFERLP